MLRGSLPFTSVALAALLLAPSPRPARGDILVAGGKPIRGTWWEEGDEVVVNPYRSTNRAMKWGVQRFPRSRVRLDAVKRTEPPEEEYCRRAFEIRAGEAAAHRELAAWCEERKLAALADREWERALEKDPADAAARKALGEAAVKAVLRRNPRANPAIGEILRAYLGEADAAARRALFDRAVKEHGYDRPVAFLERARRSSLQPKGRTDDRPLTLRSKQVKGDAGALYTLFVPSTYDPLEPHPLVLGLHGGGADGKAGDKVLGSGPSAMNFYQGLAEQRGWIVVCPTALRAPWSNPANGPFLEAVLEEAALLFHVDLHRVHLTGHSMGGFGTWHYGPLWAERFASIAPMAGGGGGGAPGRLRDTATFAFVFHGSDDAVVRVGDDRATAKALLEGGNDFAYTELDGVGHGFPPEVGEEMAAFFEVKRLAVKAGGAFRRSDEVRSSFLEKPTRDEATYLGAPYPGAAAAAGAAKPEEERKRLLADLDLGGGKAVEAGRLLGERRDPAAVKPLAQRLLAPGGKVGDDVRAAAARALGAIGAAEAVPHLEKALGDGSDLVFVAVVEALEALGDRRAGPALLRALDGQAKRFEERRMGDAMRYSDYEDGCRVLAVAARAAATLAPPDDAAARIRETVIRGALLKAPRVERLERAGNYPERIEAALCVAIARALGRTAAAAPGGSHAPSVSLIEGIRRRWGNYAEVGPACDEAVAAHGLAPEQAAKVAPPPELGP